MADFFETEIGIIVEKSISNTARQVRDEMIHQIWSKADKGYQTGALAGSVVVDHPAAYTYNIYPTAETDEGFPYGIVLDKGRRAMWKFKGAFVFYGKDGNKVVTKRVKRFDGVHFVRSTYNKFT